MPRSRSLKNLLLYAVAAASALLNCQVHETVIAQEARTNLDDGIVLIRPARRAPDAPPAPPHELPPAAGRVKPLTLDVVVHRQTKGGRAHRVHQTVSRTTDRIHIVVGGGREWLFERNPVDPRRVSGLLIDHATRTIVLHEESDLRNRLGVNGWADVLMLGLDADVLGRLEPTGRTRTLSGIRFVKQAAGDKDARTSDVWWSREQALPSAFVIRDAAGSMRMSIERLRAGVNVDLLQSPPSRFPAYKAVDLAEWLEAH